VSVIRIDIGPQPKNDGQAVMAVEVTNTGAVKLYAEERDLDLSQVARILENVAKYLRDQIIQHLIEEDSDKA